MSTTLSPSPSPRLPSPPPIAEDQSGPKSPGALQFEDHSGYTGSNDSRRIRPGMKAEEMAEGPPMLDLQDIDSAFQLTEYLKSLHSHLTHPSSTPNATIPIDTQIALELSHPPPNTSREIWLYELGRFLIQKTNTIIVALFADSPPCSAQTCPEMRASEWQYLCSLHDPPKSCAAIDYCCHTLDWAANTLTNSKMFPSRLGLGSGSTGQHGDKVLQQQMKELTNIFRRVYRIYAHAWFQHREMFWRVEGKTGLYIMFKTVCDVYGLIQAENYTIPPEATGSEPQIDDSEMERPNTMHAGAGLTLLKRPEGITLGGEVQQIEPQGNSVLATGDTTKRHRHTKSDRSISVSTIIHEEAEEEDEPGSQPSSAKPTNDKPAIVRQSSVLKSDGSGSAKDQDASEAENEPTEPATHAHETLEATPESVEEAHEDAVETTVIEIGTEENDSEVLEDTEHNETESETVVKESAADPEAAQKSVED